METITNFLPKVTENQPFEKQIAQSENQYIAKIAGRYAKTEAQFYELYDFGESKWSLITSRLPEYKWHRHGLWWIRELILEYVLNKLNV